MTGGYKINCLLLKVFSKVGSRGVVHLVNLENPMGLSRPLCVSRMDLTDQSIQGLR